MDRRAQGRVLVVDDDAVVAALIVRLLKGRFEVAVAQDGAAAIAAVAARAPDLLLLDIMMPGIDGLEVCRMLKADQRYREIPVIFLTGQGAGEQVVQGFAAGGVDYVTKPFDAAVLEARVSTHLALRESKTELVRAHRTLQDELRWAGELQQRLLAIELPEDGRASFSVAYEPLPDLHCGGDYYDVFRLAEDRYFVILGDVSGHGLRAAFITVMLKSIIYREYVKHHRDDLNLHDFLSWLNGRLCNELERLPGLFVAFLAFTLDVAKRSVTFCNAGQHLPCILREGSVIPVSRRGTSLGFNREASWEEDEVSLQPGDRIVAYTDGLVDIGGLDGAAIGDVLLSCPSTEPFAPLVIAAARLCAQGAAFVDDATVVSVLLR